MRPCIVIPAYQSEATVAQVVSGCLQLLPPGAVVVVDDGSTDSTGSHAANAGAVVLTHARNFGKGRALRTGFLHALEHGFDVVVTVDADGQHPADQAEQLLVATSDAEALVLGIRDLKTAGAPRANQISNRISNFFLSLFSGKTLQDTQCGLRRYPIAFALGLGAEDDGYAFEAEILLRAIARHVPIVEIPIRVVYPPEHERKTHFDSVRDPARIVLRVLRTTAEARWARLFGS